jgi:hypothetical protein
LIPNPIHKVLSTFQSFEVRALLMGGQACVFYGAAEVSRDTEFALHSDPANLGRLQSAMDALQASVIAVPPFSIEHLERGHAIHFRCQHPDALGLRVDVMSKMRGVAEFPALWDRRTTLQSDDGTHYELMSLPDLVQAKKTQRDKDWPMVRRLIEADHAALSQSATPDRIRFWLSEARTPSLLIDLVRRHPVETGEISTIRPLLRLAVQGNDAGLEEALATEEKAERMADRSYWAPLRSELEQMRWAR